jgi:surface protein
MSQTPIPFSSSFRSLTLNVTTGTGQNQVTHTQAITSVHEGNNSFPITDANILNAFNSQAVGTSFTPSIVATYGSDSNGNALKNVSTPSVASFVPRPPPPIISLASNNVTIQYTGATGDVPSSSARFIEADPRNTGSNEWFAVVKQDMKTAITDYAKGLPGSSTPFTPPNQPSPVPFNNIVTTLMTDMSSMFYNTAFNQNIGSWDTSNVTNMYLMFNYARAFNQNIGSWNTSKVTTMKQMFHVATAFNQNIGSWDTSNVLNMQQMFNYATAFNQNISGWVVAQISDFLSFRTNSALTTDNTPPAFR